MDELLQRMRDRVLNHAVGVTTTTAIPDLSLGVLHESLIPETAFSEPMVCIILQGVKQVLVGSQMLQYDKTRCFASAIELPATGCVLEADFDRPFVAAGLTLDPKPHYQASPRTFPGGPILSLRMASVWPKSPESCLRHSTAC